VRLVLDTNTALSGLLWGGPPGRLIEAAAGGRVVLVSSVALLAELRGVVSREKFVRQLARRGFSAGDLFEGYAALAEIAVPALSTPTIVRDPADDQVLAAALGAQADLIVLGMRICSTSWPSTASRSSLQLGPWSTSTRSGRKSPWHRCPGPAGRAIESPSGRGAVDPARLRASKPPGPSEGWFARPSNAGHPCPPLAGKTHEVGPRSVRDAFR
jgi:putative PIN family toxin of toxin-antitoxin system